MSQHASDEQHLHRALELARRGIGLASPNPYVGAVITDSHGDVVGTGWHTWNGVKHAEIVALEEAEARARGGTLYINLEPHSYQSRTPPCTDALMAAGIHRVVASMPDPNPKVSGRGFEQLRAAGVHVEIGRLEQQARKLNEAFARYIRHAVPLVTLKAAMTLDGKIAPPPAEAITKAAGIPAGGWITSDVARAHVQELRHEHDALLVGAGTILTDNPLLTDRTGKPRRRPLLRVILDSRLRTPLDSRLVQSVAAERKQDVLLFCASGEEQKQRELEARGVRVEKISAFEADGRPDLPAILRRLGKLEITSVMIEGGATVNWAALAANVVDKVFLYYAPKILAGTGSIPFAAGAGFRQLSQAAQVQHLHLHRFGEDFAVEGYLRDPYGE
ncbi:MAG TPA: bifunctional diaminohydroxyphosphoribosylaminopyrimidine deaminase/5-amino-6-(5-phosphoribosylamino)uracil reductase RibD [Candidatus Sulfotelmatobacter sp.]|nr:bifunctional diaminohydroxyphosphoribosylaminopyrimidine deaminase/5-amino-6-(5-phosphoribosylamino)uracil reductase RibD [Candidatus Sulfotelmatobacter sp.]